MMDEAAIRRRAADIAAKVRARTIPGLIYVIQGLEDGPVKIGYVSEPQLLTLRVSSLQCGNPYPLRVLATAVGFMRDEQRLHKLFKAERLTGEWFSYSKRLQVFVAQIGAKMPLEIATDAALKA